ncbi:MAG: hypothetical protein AB7P34_12600 [Vicinamibacterales bacterium]
MSKRRTVLIAAGLSLLYFGIQLAYVLRLPLVMDEFDGANEAYQLLQLTPYKDYQPYKTVLGYYLELPPLLFTTDAWTGLMAGKLWLAALNSAAVFAAALCLSALFSPAAALFGQLLLISMTTFLERSSELRVDMLTAWFGLASFLLLLNRHWLAAGAIAGVSFLVSQKGLYFILSANAAAGVFWLIEARERRTFRDLAVLNAATLAVIALYIGFWGLLSSPWTVFSATFLSHGGIVFSDYYELEGHWARTLTKNPFFYAGAVAGIAGLAAARWRGLAGGTHLMTAVYGGVLFALCRWHRQPWPYFFVILIPTLMVVHVAAAEVVLRYRRGWRVAGAVALLLGVAWPFTYMPGMLARDNSYQRHVVRLAGAMLGEGETYLAGNDLIYNRAQAHPALRRLGAARVEAIRGWPRDRLGALIAELEAARPKLVINDYRMRGLPAPVREYLETRFDPLWSSVQGYAPLVGASEREFDLWFDGEYRVEPAGGEAVIDGARVAAGTLLTLERGRHRNDSTAALRLRLQPPGLAALADPAMQRRRAMFARAYDY